MRPPQRDGIISLLRNRAGVFPSFLRPFLRLTAGLDGFSAARLEQAERQPHARGPGQVGFYGR